MCYLLTASTRGPARLHDDHTRAMFMEFLLNSYLFLVYSASVTSTKLSL